MISTILPNFAAIDTESTGIDVRRGHRMFSAAATLANGHRHFWRGDFGGLRELCEDASIDKVFHNAKHDIRMLRAAGIEVKGRYWDTMIFYHLLNARFAGKRLGLEFLAKRYLPIDQRKVVDEINLWFDEHKIGSKERYTKFGILPLDMLRRRNMGDADITAALFRKAYTTVAKVFPFLLEQEHRLIPVVMKMEDRGMTIDYDEIDKQIDRFDLIIENTQTFFEGIVGRYDFNVNSPNDQLELCEKGGLLHLLKVKSKKTGRLKLDDYNLRSTHHPVAHMLLLGKAALKMRNTFLEQMRREAINGVVHPNFNQVGTVSGRFSCTKPNLQNIPIEGDRRTAYTAAESAEMLEMTCIEYAPHLKRIFKVRKDYCHVHSDKKQAEMAMIAHYTSDKTLIDIFESGENFHDGVCRALYGEWTKGLKTRTKAVVFGFAYGAGDAQLARRIGDTIAVARDTRKRLGMALPSLPRWSKQLQEEVSERGYVTTIHGRRHYLKTKEGYIAVNRLCQGSVADEIKGRMIALDDYFTSNNLDSTVLLQVHDDIASEVPMEFRHKAIPEINRIMHETDVKYKLSLPSSLDVTYTRWADLIEVEDVHQIPEPPDPRTLDRSLSKKSRDESLLLDVNEIIAERDAA